MIKSLCRRLVPLDWEDAVQNIRMHLWQRLHQYRGQSTVATWIYRAAFNECLEIMRLYRSKKRAMNVSLGAMCEDSHFDAPANIPHPVRLINANDCVAKLQSMPELSTDLFRVQLLADGFSYEEIAMMENITLANAKSRILRSRLELQRALGVTPRAPKRRTRRTCLLDRQVDMKARHMAAGVTI